MSWKSINKLTDAILDRIAGEKYALFLVILRNWRSIVGDILAERSYPLKLDKHVLFVGVKNNIWMQELIFTKQRIIDLYKNKLKIEIKDIIFLIRQ